MIELCAFFMLRSTRSKVGRAILRKRLRARYSTARYKRKSRCPNQQQRLLNRPLSLKCRHNRRASASDQSGVCVVGASAISNCGPPADEDLISDGSQVV